MIPSNQENYRQQYAHDEVFYNHIYKVRSQYTLPYGPLVYGLVHAVNPAFIIETGTCNGYLTAWIAKAVIELNYRKFYTIDWYNEAFPHASPESQFIVRDSIDKCGVLDGVTNFIMSDAVAYFKYADDRGLLTGLGFVIIDDCHEYNHVITELNICWNNLVPGGMIFIHDVEHNGMDDLKRAVSDFIASNNISRRLWFFNSLGAAVLQRDW